MKCMPLDATECHCMPLNATEGHQIPNSLIATLASFAQPWKAPISLAMSVRPSACISAAPTGQISVQFDMGYFSENLSWKSKLP